MYVDQAEWNDLRRQAAQLAEIQRDLPKLIQRVEEQTQRDLERSMNEVESRQAGFQAEMGRLSERTQKFERRTAEQLRASTDRLRQEMTEQGRQLRFETAEALRTQRESLRRLIDQEREDRNRRLAEIDGAVARLRGDQATAARLTGEYLADAEVLLEQVRKFPHERYLPGRVARLDERLATVRGNVSDGVGAYALSGAQELCQSASELLLELEHLDQEWRACRIAAERELVKLQELFAQNATIDVSERFGPGGPDSAPSVDYWSRGALSRLSKEVATLLAQVRDDEDPLATESLLRIVTETAPESEKRLESVVGQAVTAIQASQLRTNLADMIATALDEHHYYEVTDSGYVTGDQRETFLAKTVHHASGSEIVIEVEPSPEDQPPTVRLHNFDADGAAESERTARTASIRASVYAHSGLNLGAAQEETAEPDENARDVRARVLAPTKAGPAADPAQPTNPS